MTRPVSKRANRTPTEPVDIEGLGLFYLGRKCETATGKVGPEPLLVDARRFTTHAVCVGMTGSGKTGLLIDLVEEAAIDGIPTLVIDPKGDLANLLLAFPDLAPSDFLPWVEADAAKRDGITLEALAERTAAKWKDGLAASGQAPERIARLKAAVDMAVYTPGSRAGRPLAMLESLEAPAAQVLADPELRRERIESLVSGILALAGIDAEPGRSREHVLLSAIVDALWKSGQKVDFGALVRAIPAPPVERVGFLDLENFYPAGDRFQLASRLNTVAAAPGFEAWLSGEPLDVGRLLWTAEGKPRVSVVSIAHLNDAQRMAFVTLLAGQAVAWMRSQGGTSSLKALFLMDEVFGYVPPTANPPSKGPILTLLKQARAFGLGVVLATQNPVDLDYKGLSNAGIWFLGRLQTARDKARVLDGLEGAASSAGRSFDRGRLDKLLSGLEQRMFLLHSVHDDEETVFQTRWTLAYLRGPLLREEIKRLMAGDVEPGLATPPPPMLERPDAAGIAGGPRPILPPGVREVFFAPRKSLGPDAAVRYEPAILGRARVRYAKAAARIDVDREVICLAPAGDSVGESAWEAAETLPEPPEVEPAPRTGSFASLPSTLAGPKGYAALATALKGHLARTAKLVVYSAPALDAVSRPGESEADFRLRIAQRAKEWRDEQIDDVRGRYAQKIATLADRIERARQKVEREKAEAKNQSLQTYVSIGSAVLGALLGRKMASSTTIGKAATSMRSASRAARQQADVAHAEESLSTLEERRLALEEEVEAELERIRIDADPARVVLETIDVPARKTDISVDDVVLAWIPG
ncbi:MAG: ATP-binding protein [Planctomycetia bacterium]|nr:ATP-binding protein [Planctomycetia bacterium]